MEPSTVSGIYDSSFSCALVTGLEPVHGSVSFGVNCSSLTYTASEADYFGADGFTFRVTDSGGGQGAGFELFGDQAVTVTVRGVNDAPVVSGPSAITVTEDGGTTELTTVSDIDDSSFSCALVTGLEPVHGSVSFGVNSAGVPT